MNIDGSNEKQLTDTPKNWETGDWSPDGSKMAFAAGKVSEGKLNRDIYVIDVPAS